MQGVFRQVTLFGLTNPDKEPHFRHSLSHFGKRLATSCTGSGLVGSGHSCHRQPRVGPLQDTLRVGPRSHIYSEMYADFHGELGLLGVCDIFECVGSLAECGKLDNRRKAALFLLDTIDRALDPGWVWRAFALSLETIEALSGSKCTPGLELIVHTFERNPGFFLPVAHSNRFDLVLGELGDGPEERIAAMALGILNLYFTESRIHLRVSDLASRRTLCEIEASDMH